MTKPQQENNYSDREDVHSYSKPQQVHVRHVALDLEVDFHRKMLQGTATLTLDRPHLNQSTSLVLDTRDLKISHVEKSRNASVYEPTQYRLGTRDKILGSPLTIDLPGGATTVRVHY